MAKEKAKKVRPAAALPCWFAESKRIADLHRRERKVDVSPDMLLHFLRIADLRSEVGDMLDRAGVPIRDMLLPAYGLSRAEQKRRAFEVIRKRKERAEATAARRLARATGGAAVDHEKRGAATSNGKQHPRTEQNGEGQRRRRVTSSNRSNFVQSVGTPFGRVNEVNAGNVVNGEGLALLLENGSIVKVEAKKISEIVREVTVTVKAELKAELVAYIDSQRREAKLVDALEKLG